MIIKSKCLFKYKGNEYPNYIRHGNACSFIVPYAKEFCRGDGLDVGGYFEWTFPGAKAINVLHNDGYDAYKLPPKKYDYIFSSHTLEHLSDCVKALRYWKKHLKKGGALFLYLPHPDMEYWRPQNNPKHLHLLYPKDVAGLLKDIGFRKVLHSERDLYWSFSVVGLL